MSMLKAALDAQRLGLHIFPVAAGAKVPHRAASWIDQAGQLHGWGETSTNDINRVVDFWTRVDPHANIGVACKPSQLLVVDLDRAKTDWNLQGTDWAYLHEGYGARVHGEDLLDEMAFKDADEEPGEYKETYTVQTGSGGIHHYYWWPVSWPKISQASPVKGVVDVRGNGGQHGGYVLGAGSVTQAGTYDTVNDRRPALTPGWIRRLVAEKPRQPASRPGGIRQPGKVSWSGLAETIRTAGEGNRNNSLVWAARTVCEEGGTVQQALADLGPAARAAGLGDNEIERTIESAFRTQQYKEGHA